LWREKIILHLRGYQSSKDKGKTSKPRATGEGKNVLEDVIHHWWTLMEHVLQSHHPELSSKSGKPASSQHTSRPHKRRKPNSETSEVIRHDSATQAPAKDAKTKAYVAR
jgi:hypothetical protein